MDKALSGWIEATLGRQPGDPRLYEHALTHPSTGADKTYQRLEFLGDRVLGLVIADWLYERHPGEPEGLLNQRLASLVSRKICALIGRDIGLVAHIRFGKQATSDGAGDSDNVLGDVVEALIGALFLDAGFDAARDAIRRLWAERVDEMGMAPQHPKSALQEWAAANDAPPPVYRITGETGPHHEPRFTVTAEIAGTGSAQAEGASKQEAETAAAHALLAKLKNPRSG
ncbi:MAG: ribonuclease III [Sphingomonadales bacterium]|nr:ribonuclease III [Sphingomonadales bacterium]